LSNHATVGIVKPCYFLVITPGKVRHSEMKKNQQNLYRRSL